MKSKDELFLDNGGVLLQPEDKLGEDELFSEYTLLTETEIKNNE